MATKKKKSAKKPAVKKAPKKTPEVKVAKKAAAPVEPAAPAKPEVTIADPTYQDKDINLKMLTISIGVIVLIVFGAFVSMLGLYKKYENNTYAKMSTRTQLEMPERPELAITLLENEFEYLQAHREAEAKKLNAYSWIDKPGGKVRLPVDHAMDVLLERGLPVRGDEPSR